MVGDSQTGSNDRPWWLGPPSFGDTCVKSDTYLCYSCGDDVFVAEGTSFPRCPTCDSIGPYKLKITSETAKQRARTVLALPEPQVGDGNPQGRIEPVNPRRRL